MPISSAVLSVLVTFYMSRSHKNFYALCTGLCTSKTTESARVVTLSYKAKEKHKSSP